jgi:hypothetical protein
MMNKDIEEEAPAWSMPKKLKPHAHIFTGSTAIKIGPL